MTHIQHVRQVRTSLHSFTLASFLLLFLPSVVEGALTLTKESQKRFQLTPLPAYNLHPWDKGLNEADIALVDIHGKEISSPRMQLV